MKIGETSRTERGTPRARERPIYSRLLIEGEDISNVIFERGRSPKPVPDVDDVIAQVRARMPFGPW